MSGDENMSVTLLVSALKKDPDKLIEDMHIASDAVIVDQCDNDSRREIAKDFGKILVIESTDRGVGNNRNLCIDNSFGDIVLFGDDDIVYDDDYAKKVSDEFEKHPEADLITFNVSVCEERRTYVNEGFKKLSSMNIGRYPAYSIAVKRDVLIDKKVRFSPLFGGGAKYSNGEDSLFLRDCLKKKVRIYRTNVSIGHEEPVRESTWFKGYNDKFFYDRGVLYKYLYGMMAFPMSVRFLLKNKNEMCKEKSFSQCLKLMRRGIRMSGY